VIKSFETIKPNDPHERDNQPSSKIYIWKSTQNAIN